MRTSASTTARLRDAIMTIPAGSLVPVDWVLDMLADAGDSEADPTAAEFAVMLGRAPSTIRGWCREGKLPGAYRCAGREWRIPKESLRSLRGEQKARGHSSGRESGDLAAWREVLR
jgi:hypothetical protein